MPDTYRDIAIPDLQDPMFAPFWQGLAANELRVQCCAKCLTHYWPPRALCMPCNAFELDWVAVEPRGPLFSWTVVGKATAKGFPDAPYVVGIVQLDSPNVRVVGNVVGTEPTALRAGMRLQARFVKAGENGVMNIIEWHPEERAAPK